MSFEKIFLFLILVFAMEACMHKSDEISEQDKGFLQLAFKVAEESREHGSHPFGAILVYKNRVFLKGENKVGDNINPLKHAEIILLERYVEYKNASHEQRLLMAPDFGGELPEIKDCQMFTSTQPCQMCEGAIYTMKVGRNLKDKPQVVFGLDKDNLSLVVRGKKGHNREVKVAGPYLLEQAKVPHLGFW